MFVAQRLDSIPRTQRVLGMTYVCTRSDNYRIVLQSYVWHVNVALDVIAYAFVAWSAERRRGTYALRGIILYECAHHPAMSVTDAVQQQSTKHGSI